MNTARFGSTGTADDDFVPDPQTLEILVALSEGLSMDETARACLVSGRTMRRKLADLRDAWGVDSTVEAVVRAVRQDLI
jgi:DNA-binding NarL/FixJ family response regulator